MKVYPIIIPTLCRYEKFKNAIESLKLCKLADKTELVIGLDYPLKETQKEGWKLIKEYIPTIKGFKKVIVLEQNKNIGAANNSLFLKQYVAKEYDAYIYSEDDNIFSPYFLQYMNNALKKYKNEKDIYFICGYSYPITWKTNSECLIQNQYFSAWGYGTWFSKFNTLSLDLTSNHIKSKFNMIKLFKMCLKSPSNFINIINMILQDEIKPHDVSFSFYLYMKNYYILMPKKTLVSNDGWDGTGEHCAEITHYDFRNFNRNEEFVPDVENVKKIYSKELEKIIYSMQPRFSYLKSFIKYVLILIFGLSFTKKKLKK